MTAEIFDEAGIPVLLVGDSAGNNFLGMENTIPVTVDELIPLVRAVTHSTKHAMVVADLPFGSYEASAEQALASSLRFMKEAGANAVITRRRTVGASSPAREIRNSSDGPSRFLLLNHFTNSADTKCKAAKMATLIVEAAIALEEAGAFSIVLELIPADLAARITRALKIPTIGIGAGVDCDAQVLVWTDLMGLTKKPTATCKGLSTIAR
ncbi:MAG: 3-methyl-2-oxobutanoate hydroxymethyltransferase [Actinomycetota bacterium]